MTSERTEDIERGVRLILRSGEVMPEDADEGTLRVYESVRERLRVPFVNFFFRVLANYPAYLSLAWGKLESHLLSRRFERAADDLRARALPEPVPELASADWAALGDLESIRPFTDTIHYALPKLLLVASAFDEGLGGAPGAQGGTPEIAVSPGVAEGTVALPMISPDEATGKTRRIFEEIRGRHGHPGVASYYRAIGQWPEFLKAVWDSIGPLVGSAPYEETKRGLLERSREVVGGFPLASRKEAAAAGVDEERIGELRAVLAIFRYRVICDTFIEVALIKALLDSDEAARSSRFSFADRGSDWL